MRDFLAADIAQTGAIGAVTVMLGALFAAFLKAMADAAKRSDASAEARVAVAQKAEEVAWREVNYWRTLYLAGGPPEQEPDLDDPLT